MILLILPGVGAWGQFPVAPGAGQAGAGEAVAGKAGAGQAGAEEAVAGKAGAGQAGGGQMGAGRAGAGQAGAGQVGVGQTGVGQAGEQQAAQETPTFTAGVSMVRVDVQVVEGRRVVGDLGKDDFEVLDEGVARPIEYFGHEAEPLHLVLLLDVSGSMRKLLDQMAAASKAAMAQLRAEDSVAVIAFGRTSVTKLEFSHDKGDAAAAVGAARFEKAVGAGTLLNPAIVEAAKYIQEKAAGRPGRRALLVFTDNDSVNYQSPDREALEALYAADTVLSAIVTPGAKAPDAKKSAFANPDFSAADVFKLARESGGEVMEAGKGEALGEMVERIRTRYSLHYRAPEGGAAGFRRIEVRLSAGARARWKKAEVRARAGYVAR